MIIIRSGIKVPHKIAARGNSVVETVDTAEKRRRQMKSKKMLVKKEAASYRIYKKMEKIEYKRKYTQN